MKIALLLSIIILYFLKSILELEFSIDVYIPIAVTLGVFGLLSVNNFKHVNKSDGNIQTISLYRSNCGQQVYEK